MATKPQPDEPQPAAPREVAPPYDPSWSDERKAFERVVARRIAMFADRPITSDSAAAIRRGHEERDRRLMESQGWIPEGDDEAWERYKVRVEQRWREQDAASDGNA